MAAEYIIKNRAYYLFYRSINIFKKSLESELICSNGSSNVVENSINKNGSSNFVAMEVLQGRQITLVTRPAQEPVSVISRNGVCNVNIITPWDKVERLGSGSCGIVYRGISSEGSFFGVKEVLLEE